MAVSTRMCSMGGYHPFDPYGCASEAELQDNVKKLKYDFEDEAWANVSPEAKDFISSMLKVSAKDRPSARRLAR